MSLMTILDRVADVPTFDKVIEPARRAVNAALRPQGLKDLLHGTWLGHPLHPVMVQVPVGSWLSAGLLDAVPRLRPGATVPIGTGVGAAVPALPGGAADWAAQDAAGGGSRLVGAGRGGAPPRGAPRGHQHRRAGPLRRLGRRARAGARDAGAG